MGDLHALYYIVHDDYGLLVFMLWLISQDVTDLGYLAGMHAHQCQRLVVNITQGNCIAHPDVQCLWELQV